MQTSRMRLVRQVSDLSIYLSAHVFVNAISIWYSILLLEWSVNYYNQAVILVMESDSNVFTCQKTKSVLVITHKHGHALLQKFIVVNSVQYLFCQLTLRMIFPISKNVFLFSPCAVSVEVLVCKVRYIFRVVYSVFAVLWNSLVAFVLVSTCRTHVIGTHSFA